MNKRSNVWRSLGAFAMAGVVVSILAVAPLFRHSSAHSIVGDKNDAKLSYPESKKVDQADDFFGTKVADPYRWLEDENSAETKNWVNSQNAVTFAYLDKIPFREKLKARLTQLSNYPRITAPFRRGNTYFFTKNDGLQNQNVYYIQQGVKGRPEVFLDPNKFSTDGTSVLRGFSLSKDGKYVAYGISQGGADWIIMHVMEVATRQELSDKLEWLKGGGVSWQGNGFYYSRYPLPEKGRELTTKNEFQTVYFHTVGSPQSADILVYEDKQNPQRFHNVSTTEDQRFAILNISERGKGKQGNAIFYKDLSKGEKDFSPIVAEISDTSYSVIDNVGDKFLVNTDKNAPNGRVVLIDPKSPNEKNWQDVLPERSEPLQGVGTAGGKLFASWRKDVATRAYVFSLAGKLENEIKLPGIGTANGFGGLNDDKYVFYSFTSFNFPATIYEYDIATRRSTVFHKINIPSFRPEDYETKQVFFNSKDGTRVPMFLVYKKGVKLDGNNPTLLYGYGGFNIVTAPNFSSTRLALLEQGVVYASCNMRGGGEYGEKWHEAGTKLKKQNVFDDFIAAAEYLIAQKYTSSSKLAIQGGSNGGLLVGAVSNQRPELFRAVVEQAGVMDMLRFHKFTIGWNWIADYGSAEANEAEFKALYAYSPIHNVKAGTKYPATLITTADHDDRVVPAHNFKYAAALQAAQAGDGPILIRIDTNSAHGASSTTKSIEQTRDIYAFLFENLGVEYGGSQISNLREGIPSRRIKTDKDPNDRIKIYTKA
ncbi:MAG TPA: prolyl oligopeptidase family serine peptidase [Pyrinomonadaceae bacterium]|nr:prolyl oligopeptidase family serine peptidase [Pyrinomonadaceae bacterium]